MNLPFDQWMPTQRWYAGRTRTLTGVRTALVVPLAADLDLALLDAEFADGPAERYQVVIRWTAGPRPDFPDRARIGQDGDRTAYDGLYDPAAAQELLGLVDRSAEVGPLRFIREPGVALPVGATPRVIGAEQSNTSVVFGDAAIFKVFRRVTPGINPDIELNRDLGRAGNQHVARLLGAIETTLDGEPHALGMGTAFAAGSTEGWDMATSTAGADFAAESHGLGAAVASVHRALAESLGTAREPFPVDVLVARLTAMAALVPELGPYRDLVEKRYRDLDSAEITVQRVHGDLHLGQVLRAPAGWLVIDFEGEPGQPLSERRRPDSPLRDVAGVLRSYEYAAHQRTADGVTGADEGGRSWADANRAAFCDGYAAAAGIDPRDFADVLAAYELDKAVYEAGYESRYRPSWLPIPMGSIARLVS